MAQRLSWRLNSRSLVWCLGLVVTCGWWTACAIAAHEVPTSLPASQEVPALQRVDGVSVLCVSGSASERGKQLAAALRPVIPELLSYPEKLYAAFNRADAWKSHLQLAARLQERIPKEHLAELTALAEEVGVPLEYAVAVNTLPDVYRSRFGCSSVVVGPTRSATGGTIFGRNLDFFGLGKLQQFGLVIVYRLSGKHSFASVTFPGFIGCLSGMNDAGLALAVHEGANPKPGTPFFDPEGVPLGFVCRQVLEECQSVEEAINLLKSCRHTSPVLVVLADRHIHAVVEIVPGQTQVRQEDDGIALCTNHYRTSLAGRTVTCSRYEKLLTAKSKDHLGVEEVMDLLHAVNQGQLTIQSMVFQPAELTLRLSLGRTPASLGPYVLIDLKAWLCDKRESVDD